MTKIINFFGAPGSGKTTAAAEAFVKAKKNGFSAVLVQEYASELILEGKKELLADQKLLFDEQLRRINIAYGKVDYIIVDSPLLLNAIYHRLREKNPNKSFEKSVIDTHHSFNQENVLLKYNPDNFSSVGRITSKDDSFHIEKSIKNVLDETQTPYVKLDNFEQLNEKLNHLFERGKK